MKKNNLIIGTLILIILGMALVFVVIRFFINQKSVGVQEEKKKSMAEEINKNKENSLPGNVEIKKEDSPDGELTKKADDPKNLEEEESLEDREPEDDLDDIIEDPEVE